MEKLLFDCFEGKVSKCRKQHFGRTDKTLRSITQDLSYNYTVLPSGVVILHVKLSTYSMLAIRKK